MLSEAYDKLETAISIANSTQIKELETLVSEVTHEERVAYQDMQSQLFASGIITLRDASMIYNALGEGVTQNTWDGLPLTMKVFIVSVLPMLYQEWQQTRSKI